MRRPEGRTPATSVGAVLFLAMALTSTDALSNATVDLSLHDHWVDQLAKLCSHTAEPFLCSADRRNS